MNLPLGTLVLLDLPNILRYPATPVMPLGGSGTIYKNQSFLTYLFQFICYIFATNQYLYLI
jgi:hypothetical protein